MTLSEPALRPGHGSRNLWVTAATSSGFPQSNPGIPACPGKTCLKVIPMKHGRGERIRTSDSCVPNAVLYQAELHPELTVLFTCARDNRFLRVGSNCTQEGISGQFKFPSGPRETFVSSTILRPYLLSG